MYGSGLFNKIYSVITLLLPNNYINYKKKLYEEEKGDSYNFRPIAELIGPLRTLDTKSGTKALL